MYHLIRFGNVTFPPNMPIAQMPTVRGMESTIKTLNGGFDAWGSDVAPPLFPTRVQFRALVTGGELDTMHAKVDQLRAMGRKRALLYRSQNDIHIQYAAARVLSVDLTSTPHTQRTQEILFEFDVWDYWRSNPNQGWILDDGLMFDSGLIFDATPAFAVLTTSPQAIEAINHANVAVDDAVLTIVAGNAPITALTIACGRAKWTWTGTLAAGKSLVVDVGAWSIKNDGIDAYAGFAFDATHALNGLLRLEPGSNIVTVTRTGGGTGSTVKITFAEAWA